MTDRQSTHGHDCWDWGPKHYGCAVREVKALRAEVAEAREFRDKIANAIGNDQLRRFIEKHGEPVPLTIRMQEAEARAERLAKEVEALRAKTAVTMGVGTGDGKLFVHGDHESIKAAQAIVLERDALRAEVDALTARLGYIYQIADAALAREDRNG